MSVFAIVASRFVHSRVLLCLSLTILPFLLAPPAEANLQHTVYVTDTNSRRLPGVLCVLTPSGSEARDERTNSWGAAYITCQVPEGTECSLQCSLPGYAPVQTHDVHYGEHETIVVLHRLGDGPRPYCGVSLGFLGDNGYADEMRASAPGVSVKKRMEQAGGWKITGGLKIPNILGDSYVAHLRLFVSYLNMGQYSFEGEAATASDEWAMGRISGESAVTRTELGIAIDLTPPTGGVLGRNAWLVGEVAYGRWTTDEQYYDRTGRYPDREVGNTVRLGAGVRIRVTDELLADLIGQTTRIETGYGIKRTIVGVSIGATYEMTLPVL